MNRSREVCEIQVSRAKPLRPGDSGVFRALHAPEGGAANDASPASMTGLTAAEQVPSVRLRSPERTAVRAEAASIFDTCCALHGLENADVGAMINEAKEDARRIRAGWKPLTLDHQIRIARRNPRLWADIRARVEGQR